LTLNALLPKWKKSLPLLFQTESKLTLISGNPHDSCRYLIISSFALSYHPFYPYILSIIIVWPNQMFYPYIGLGPLGKQSYLSFFMFKKPSQKFILKAKTTFHDGF
jgi:hypothetical protein